MDDAVLVALLAIPGPGDASAASIDWATCALVFGLAFIGAMIGSLLMRRRKAWYE